MCNNELLSKMSKMKDKTHNMNSTIKNHKIKDYMMDLEPWL